MTKTKKLKTCRLIMPIRVGHCLELAGGYQAGHTTIKIKGVKKFPHPETGRPIRSVSLAIFSHHHIGRAELPDLAAQRRLFAKSDRRRDGLLVLSRCNGQGIQIDGPPETGGVYFEAVKIQGQQIRTAIIAHRGIEFIRVAGSPIFDQYRTEAAA